MPPKASRKKDDSSVPTLPAISPALVAAQIKFDKWVRRVQDLTRAKTDAIRHKSGLMLTLREGEAKVRRVNEEADLIAFQPLRPPPPPPPQPLTPTPPAPKGRKPPQGTSKIASPPEPVVEAWVPPEPAEAKRLQKAAEALLAAYFTKRGGVEKPPENEKNKKSSLYKRRLVTVDSPSSLATAAAVAIDPNAVSPAEAGPSPSIGGSADVSPQSPSKGGGKGGGKKDAKNSKRRASEAAISDDGAEGPMQTISLSIAASAAEPSPGGSDKGGRTPRGGRGRAKSGAKGDAAEVAAAPHSPTSQVPTLPPIHPVDGAALPSLPEERQGVSFRGLDGLAPSPLADGMEKPRHASYEQWHSILQLRQERLDLEDANSIVRADALQARDRVAQLREMEALGRYGLSGAQHELEAITGTPVAPIPGVTAPAPPPPIPQPPGTPRTAAAAAGGQSPAASPEASPAGRAAVSVR